MVAWEGGGVGWFYWNFKMEGGAFAEWDFLRGVREGWIPTLEPSVRAEDAFGTCESIIFKTDDSMDIVDTFPDPTKLAPDWQSVEADDDVVVSHGQSLGSTQPSMESRSRTPLLSPLPAPLHDYPSKGLMIGALCAVGFALFAAKIVRSRQSRFNSGVYARIPEAEIKV